MEGIERADSPDVHAMQSWVSAQLDALRAELLAEVRTRSVVVVDERGRPIIVLACDRGTGLIELRAGGGEGGVSVEVTTHRGPADSAAAVSLTRRGNVVAALSVTDSEEGTICRLVFDGEVPGRAFVIDASGARFE